MGQKDYQQVAVIQRMLDLNESSVELIACPTVRSDQGLALSSRNKNLTEEQKHQALSISKGFSITDLNLFKAYLLENGFEKIDYISCVDPITLKEKKIGDRPYLVLVAAFIGGVRLIDNKLFV
jgi:pantoate--beta-alanine ligase